MIIEEIFNELLTLDCVKKVPKTWILFQVRLGEWDTTTNPDCEEEANERVCNDVYIEVPVTESIVHENYVPESRHQQHDIALLRMQRQIQYTDFIKPICLPTETSLRSLDFTGLIKKNHLYYFN